MQRDGDGGGGSGELEEHGAAPRGDGVVRGLKVRGAADGAQGGEAVRCEDERVGEGVGVEEECGGEREGGVQATRGVGGLGGGGGERDAEGGVQAGGGVEGDAEGVGGGEGVVARGEGELGGFRGSVGAEDGEEALQREVGWVGGEGGDGVEDADFCAGVGEGGVRGCMVRCGVEGGELESVGEGVVVDVKGLWGLGGGKRRVKRRRWREMLCNVVGEIAEGGQRGEVLV